MGFSEFKTTRSGREMIAAAVAGGKLSLTKIQMGDGRITSQSIYGLTGLISPVHDVEIASKEVKQGTDKNGETANYALIKGHFKKSELEKSFYFREIGVYAKIDDGEEKLITYNNAYDLADYIDKESAEIQDRTLVIPVFIGEVKEIDVVINVDMTYVSIDDFERHKKDKLLHLPTGGEAGQVPVKTESGVEWKLVEVPPSFSDLLTWPDCTRITNRVDSNTYVEQIVDKATRSILKAKRVTVKNADGSYTVTIIFYEEDGVTVKSKYVIHTTKDVNASTYYEEVTREVG